MKIRWELGGKRWCPWAGARGVRLVEIAGVALAACVLGTAAWLHLRGSAVPPACLLRAGTGIPCPACGGTRAGLLLLTGDVGAAFRQNPLAAVTIMVVLAAAALHYALGLRVRLTASRGERAALWVLMSAAVAASWAWLLFRGT